MRAGIVDMGTNTFNLLVAEVENEDKYHILFIDRQAVQLGKSGINKHIILPDAFERAENAMNIHVANMKKFEVEKMYALGTSAIRSAANKEEFTTFIKQKFNIDIHVISGDQEAGFIYKGVKQTVHIDHGHEIILDIGGGSNEFIIANQNEILWKHSFNLGIARLLNKFHPSDPIKPEEIEIIEQYFEQSLGLLFEAASKYNPSVLIGASGSFDTFRSLIFHEPEPNGQIERENSKELGMDEYHRLYETLIKSTREQRLNYHHLEPIRVDYIVLASLFTSYILKKLNINQLFQSDYSLKEGVIWDLIKGVI